MLAAGAAAQAPPAPQLSQADLADLDQISAYLNSIHTLQGDFVQINPDGSIGQGKFYLEKPGKLRFAYKPPSPMLVVSDGHTVAVANTKLKTLDRYPLSSTPLDLVLSDNLDLRHNKDILAVEHQPDTLIVLARTDHKRAKANIRMVFSSPIIELKEWTVLDDQGQTTTVALRGQETGVDLDPKLFVLRETTRAVGTKQRD